jgi:thiol:disulfide interchange protein DsbD
LVADTTAIAPGKPFTVGLHLEIADGWHVYWINPGDAGAATKLVLKVPDGFSAGSVQFPVPEKLDLPGGLTVYGYEKELLLMAIITPPADLKAAANAAISADASWCVCNPEECVLGNKSLELNLPVAAGGMPANATLFAGWKARMPISSTEAFSSVQEHGGGGSSGRATGVDSRAVR